MEFSLEIKSEDEKKCYTLSAYKNELNELLVWIRNEEGEGMGMTKQQFFEHVDKWFKENL